MEGSPATFILLKHPPVARRRRTLVLRVVWNPPSHLVPWHLIQIVCAPVQPMTRPRSLLPVVTRDLSLPTRIDNVPKSVAMVLDPLRKLLQSTLLRLPRQTIVRESRPKPNIPV